MTNAPYLVLIFHRNDGHLERTTVSHCTVAEAIETVRRMLRVINGLYTKADVYQNDELVETVLNDASVRVTSILVQ